MTSERILYQIVLGITQDFPAPEKKNAAIAEIDEKLTRVIGGITRFDGIGTWTPGSEQSDYTGELEVDHAIIYNLSLMPNEENDVMTKVKAIITEVVRRYDLPIDHVHTSRMPTTEAIFAISKQD